MAWAENQFKELRDALISAFSLAKFDSMLEAELRRKREPMVVVGPGVGLTQVVETVLGVAEAEGWTADLVRGATEANPGNPQLRQYVTDYPERNPAAILASADPYQAMLLIGTVFLGRTDLRARLQKCGVGNNPRVMLVKGGRGSGKSHSRALIEHVVSTAKPPPPAQRQECIFLELDSFPVPPEVLVKRIGMRLELDVAKIPPQTHEQDARWVNGTLVDWLKTGLKRAATTIWWLVLDGFRVQTLPAATYDLIGQLAEEAQSPASNLRVVLLNYPDVLPPQITRVLKEVITDPPVDRSHIEAFVKWLYEGSGTTYNPEDLTDDVEDILKQVGAQIAGRPDEKALWLPAVNQALTTAADRFSV